MSARVLHNAIFNLLGGVIPAIAALLTVPVIVGRLGEVHYGIFALVTTLVGYFALLDINATAGSIKYLSEYHAKRDIKKVSEVICFGASVYAAIGLLGLILLWSFSDWLIQHVFQVPPIHYKETSRALQWAAWGFLLGQLQVYLASIPQALQRYDISAKIEGVFGSLVSLSTVVVVLAGGSLVEIMLVRVVISAVNCLVLATAIRKLLPEMEITLPSREIHHSLLHFSAYSYLSRFATISYLNSDKLFIGALQDMRALSMYTVPFMLVNRVMGLVFRLAHVVFPLTSSLSATGDMHKLEEIYVDATRYYTFLNASIIATLMLFSRELLHYWAGSVFGTDAALVFCIIGLAVFIDSLTNLPSLVNDGLGKPRNTGVMAFSRAMLGLLLGYISISYFGILGAAGSLLFVALVMTTVFIVYVHRHAIPFSFIRVCKSYAPAFLLLCPTAIFAFAVYHRPVLKVQEFFGALLVWGLLLGAVAWLAVLRPHHRLSLSQRLEATVARMRKSRA